MIRIVYIEDDIETQKILKLILPPDYIVTSCTTGRRGLSLIRKENPDLVLLDIGLPDIDGFTVMEHIMEITNPPPVIVLTCRNECARIVEAVKKGAVDYLVKPYTKNGLIDSIQKAIQDNAIRHGNCLFSGDPVLNRFIGACPKTNYIRSILPLYSNSSSPVLITGESGTGKDLVAGLIHDLSDRKKNPFLALNCSAIPLTILESELFGSEAGAFTGAVSKSGKIECADRGTLFLDEIGDMELPAQVKLLRFIEDQTFMRIGGTRCLKVDVRIIAATNRPLKQMVAEKLFREDLYYRLRILPIEIPPLRDRKEDIPLLLAHFLGRNRQEPGELSPGAMGKLLAHSWPGNIRELKSVLERAVIHAGTGTIEARHILF